MRLWKALWGRRALTERSPGLVLSPRSFPGVSRLLHWSRPASSPWLPVRHRAAPLGGASGHHPCVLSRARCRGQHGGEDEAAGVCPEQKEGAGAPEPEPLPLQRPPLLVRVSAACASSLRLWWHPLLHPGAGWQVGSQNVPEHRSEHGVTRVVWGQCTWQSPRAVGPAE